MNASERTESKKDKYNVEKVNEAIEAKLTQCNIRDSELAGMLNVSKSHFSQIRSGSTPVPAHKVMLWSRVLNARLLELRPDFIL